jgi:hypothetical protein
MSDDRFFERLRDDATPLRYELDDTTMTRMAARIRSAVPAAPPTVAQLLASWFRPLAATLSAVALAATLGIALTPSAEEGETSVAADPVEISIAGDSFRVGE